MMPLQPFPTFRATRALVTPSWLSSGEGGTVGYVLDLLKDALAERARRGLLYRFPQNDPTGQTTAPDDALAALGRDRVIVRGLNESSQSYAARLVGWLDTHQTRGNPWALMGQLAAYCGPLPSFRTVDVRGNWYSRAADGTQSALINEANWDWDGASDALERWSRFWVIIYPNGLWTAGPTYGSGPHYGDPGRTRGTTATSDQVQSVRGIVSAWKPGGTRCVNIIIAFDSTSFTPTTVRDGTGLPDGNWGNYGKIVGGVQVPARLSTARYWSGI